MSYFQLFVTYLLGYFQFFGGSNGKAVVLWVKAKWKIALGLRPSSPKKGRFMHMGKHALIEYVGLLIIYAIFTPQFYIYI